MSLIIVSFVFLLKQSLSSTSDWDYDHMTEWADSFSMCDNQDESPINIQTSDAVYDEQICNAFFDWEIQYDITNFKFINNGHSIVLKPVAQLNIDPNHEIDSTLFDTDGTEYNTLTLSENTIAKFPNYFKPINSPHDQFCLDSLHFHWGANDSTGSEHFVNQHQHPLELHFIHFSCNHASLGTTLNQFSSQSNVIDMKNSGEDIHQLGIVAIFFDVIDEIDTQSGEEYINPAFETLLSDVNTINILPGHNDKIIHGINLKDIIPETIQTDGYFAYEGSLTTPPCTDNVRWHIMNATGKIGKSQMEKFRKLYLKKEGLNMVPIAPNYREIQENINTVYGCMGLSQVVENTSNKTQSFTIITIVIISTIVTLIIIGIISLIIKLRNNAKLASNITKSNSANKDEIDRQHNAANSNTVISHKLQQIPRPRYDSSGCGNRMSIDI